MRVIPARHTVDVAHLRDPDVQPRVVLTSSGEPDARSHDGHTACGLPLLLTEVWVPWPDPKDDPAPTCTACRNGRVGTTEPALFDEPAYAPGALNG